MHFSYQNFKQFDVASLECPCLTMENQIVTQVMSFVVTFSMPYPIRNFTTTEPYLSFTMWFKRQAFLYTEYVVIPI